MKFVILIKIKYCKIGNIPKHERENKDIGINFSTRKTQMIDKSQLFVMKALNDIPEKH